MPKSISATRQIACFDGAIGISPDSFDAWYWRSRALHNLKRYEEAIASYDRAIEINPDSHDSWYWRGCALYQLKQYQEAIASYDKSIEINPDFQSAKDDRKQAQSKLRFWGWLRR